MSVVIDASFAIYLGASASGPRSGRSPGEFSQRSLQAPTIFWHEVASGLRGMMLRREIDVARRTEAIQGVRALGIVLEPGAAQIERVIEVSDRYQLTIYDAAYLELAIRAGGELATRDGGLIRAASRAGVGLITMLS